MSRIRALACVAIAGLIVSGCAKKYTLDPSFKMPEGVASSQIELITFLDGPVTKVKMKDKGRVAKVDLDADSVYVDPDNGTLGLTQIYTFGPGTVRGMIVNRSPADGMEIFRTESSGGARPIFDFAVTPTRRWVDGRSELYEFSDSDPTRVAGSIYIARGLIGGTGGPASPLTTSSSPVVPTLTNIRYTALRDGTLPTSGLPETPESTFVMRWTEVPGAARYWIHVFEQQTGFLGLRDRILRGAPAPIQPFGARDIFIASIPAATVPRHANGDLVYRMGQPGATFYTFRTPRMRAEYFVRISAVDAGGRMIGMNTGPNITGTNSIRSIAFVEELDYVADFTDPEVANSSPPVYLFFSRGAARVSPGEVEN